MWVWWLRGEMKCGLVLVVGYKETILRYDWFFFNLPPTITKKQLTFLSSLQGSSQTLIMLLYIIIIKQFSKWNLWFLWIPDTPNVFYELLYFIVQSLLLCAFVRCCVADWLLWLFIGCWWLHSFEMEVPRQWATKECLSNDEGEDKQIQAMATLQDRS